MSDLRPASAAGERGRRPVRCALFGHAPSPTVVVGRAFFDHGSSIPIQARFCDRCGGAFDEFYRPENYCCKVAECDQPFAYDHRCERHAEAEDE